MSTEHFSFDELIAKLTQLRDSGVPGSTFTAIRTADKNGGAVLVQRIEGAGRLDLAKVSHEIGQGWCRVVSVAGVGVLVIR